MSKLSFDSPLSRRIVLSFLRFLDSVELAPGCDHVGLEVAKECLAEAFKIDGSSMKSLSNSDSLADIFTSWDKTRKHQNHENVDEESKHAKGDGSTRKDLAHGMSIDDLFGQYVGALERIHYFKSMPDGSDDQVQLDRIANIFYKAVEEMQQSEGETYDKNNLAETFKLQGNKAMQLKRYSEAIELYTFSIALCENNAVYYCNRAAAYTQIEQYEKAVIDCLKSIEVNPQYSKAYSRLGFAYYAQGKYRDAIVNGFAKALSLDPNNESAKQNIRMAEEKLKEEQRSQSWSSADDHGERHNNNNNNNNSAAAAAATGQSRRQSTPPPAFASMQFDSTTGPGGMPVDIASVLRNIGAPFTSEPETEPPNGFGSSHSNSTSTSTMGGNVNLEFGEEMPQEFLRSIMTMFSGAPPPGNPENNINGRSAPPS